MVLLSTSEPLPDPEALQFDVVAKASRDMQQPLERLLSDTSRGTRDASPAEMPTNWGISFDYAAQYSERSRTIVHWQLGPVEND